MPEVKLADCIPVKHAARMTGLSSHKVLLEVASGRIKSVVMPGRPVMISLASVEAFIEEFGTIGTAK